MINNFGMKFGKRIYIFTAKYFHLDSIKIEKFSILI